MKTTINSLLLLCLCFTLHNGFAQSPCTEYFYGEHVISIEEDAAYLWLGTNANGLIRFDKVTEAKTYFDTTNSAISSNNVRSLLYHKGELLLSTEVNLMRFDNGNFSVLSDTIKGLLRENSAGDLIVGDTYDGDNRVYYLNGSTVTQRIDLLGSLFTINDMTVDSSDRIWLARDEFYNCDVLMLDGMNQQVFNNSNTVFTTNNPFAWSITSFGNNIWLSLNKANYSYNGTWQFEHQTLLPDGTINNGVDTMKQQISVTRYDADGILWCGSTPVGLPYTEIEIFYKQNGSWHFLPRIDTFPTGMRTMLHSTYEPVVYYGSTQGFIRVDKSCLGLVSTAPAEDATAHVRVYPNPATERVQIEAPGLQVRAITLAGLDGKVLRSYAGETKECSIKGLPAGIYLLQIDTDQGRVVKKVLKD